MSRSSYYIAYVVPGLEGVAESEIVAALEVEPPFRVLREFDERTSMLIFRYAGPPPALLALGTVEDVFALAVESETVPTSRAGLAAIRAAVARGPAFPGAVDRAFAVRPRRRRGREVLLPQVIAGRPRRGLVLAAGGTEAEAEDQPRKQP